MKNVNEETMKKKIYFTAIFVFFVIMIISCQKIFCQNLFKANDPDISFS